MPGTSIRELDRRQRGGRDVRACRGSLSGEVTLLTSPVPRMPHLGPEGRRRPQVPGILRMPGSLPGRSVLGLWASASSSPH